MNSQVTKANLRLLVYRLMYDAFIEMRLVASEGRGHKGIFRITDLLHNLPLKLERIDREGGSYEELFKSIQEHADRNGSRAWLDAATERIERSIQTSEDLGGE